MKEHTSTAFQRLMGAWGRRSEPRGITADVAEEARNRRDIDFARCAAAGPFVS